MRPRAVAPLGDMAIGTMLMAIAVCEANGPPVSLTKATLGEGCLDVIG